MPNVLLVDWIEWRVMFSWVYTYLSTLIAVMLRILAVQAVTSIATQKLQARGERKN